MELTVDFTCPRCHQIAKQKLVELAPGHTRQCTVCQVPLELTDVSLRALGRDLETYCLS